MKPTLEAPFLVVVGALGGMATSAGAIASLISYPALLAVGVPPLTANVTNSVAVVGTGITATLASGPELRGTAPRLIRWSLTCGFIEDWIESRADLDRLREKYGYARDDPSLPEPGESIEQQLGLS